MAIVDMADLNSSSVVEWISSSLAELLNFAGTEDIARYIITIESPQDVEEYLLAILDKTNKEHVQFIEKFLNFLKNNQSAGPIIKDVPKVNDDKQAIGGARPKKKFIKPQDSVSEENINDKNASHSKKNKKYVPIYSQEAKEKDVIQLGGRHSCECEARKHKLINNCMKCGRIVCEQEGSGSCFFCGNLVCTKAEQEILNRQSRKSMKLYETLMHSSSHEIINREDDDNYQRAAKHKDKLLEYDRTCERRTQVIDDEADYYSVDSNKWLSPKERKILKQKQEEIQALKHMSRKDRKITLDFAGRQVTVKEEIPVIPEVDPNILAANFGADIEGSRLMPRANPQINCLAPVYICDVPNSNISKPKPNNLLNYSKLQTGDLQTMSDQGKGLSMHQPYASMLVAGIKKHEGRSWYAPHRGRLWIASTVKTSTSKENNELENMYRNYYESESLTFPIQYPAGCLLGCVDVVDCLGQEEYRLNFPNGESLSPYVLICENPQELILKFPMKGEHKIYSLDPNIHQAALSAIKKATT